MMRTTCICMALVMLTGCAAQMPQLTLTSLVGNPPPCHNAKSCAEKCDDTHRDACKLATCYETRENYRLWCSVAKGLAVAAGGGALGAAFPSDQSNRGIVGGVSLGVGVVSALVAFLADSYAEDYSNSDCKPAGGAG